MDYIPAGNLYEFLNGNTLTLREAKVCGAEIVCAIAHLHQHHIAYRDLKLENILISNDGHLLLTDFGLARKIKNNKKLNDEAGTFNYFAPGLSYLYIIYWMLKFWFLDNLSIFYNVQLILIEMLSGSKSHSFEVDWWTLGITMAELLIGHSPFLRSADENPAELEICRRILDTEPDLMEIRMMDGTNDSAMERFIQALLIKDPAKRLGRLMLWIFVYNIDIFHLLFFSFNISIDSTSIQLLFKVPAKQAMRP